MDLMEGIKAALAERDQRVDSALAKNADDMTKLMEKVSGFDVNLIDLGQKMASFDPSERAGRRRGNRSLGSVAAQELLDGYKSGNGPASVKAFFDVETKAVLSSIGDAAAGYPVPPDQQLVAPIVLPYFWTALASVPTTSNVIQVVRATFTNAADEVDEGALKPESTNEFEPENVPVSTIATWKQASLQVLDDVAALQGFIDTELRDGVNQSTDRAVLSGAGGANRIKGLMKAGTQQDGASDGNLLDTVLGVVASLQAKGATRVVVGLNPLDIIGMAIMKSVDGSYLLNPLSPLTGVLGAQFVPSAAIPRGQYCAVATPQGAYVALRQGMSVAVSREDRDNFVKNMVTILAEHRLALAIPRPDLVLYGTLVPAADGGAAAKAAAAHKATK
ncbi:phage major capsid protein [Paraburkholderia pallida]|uniref:Phage major capsid protein n=1 Tax=Paraburkholderia pallida TaxID=2547399 RepID=A0A4P7CT13_9BURK|nr:phage major capsid protein [Paraburkholderia pallida]QBQ97866.1 phage major capsid protein [Paraburkholderia pallida]